MTDVQIQVKRTALFTVKMDKSLPLSHQIFSITCKLYNPAACPYTHLPLTSGPYNGIYMGECDL